MNFGGFLEDFERILCGIETALYKAGVLTILLDTEPALLPFILSLTELFDCHVCHM